MKKLSALLAAGAVICTTSALAQLDSSYYEATPTYVETFAGGTTDGTWVIDPNTTGSLPGQTGPTVVTATPAGIAAGLSTADPVASSADGSVLMMGNDSSTSGTLFGLNYLQWITAADSTDLTTLNEFKFVIRVYAPVGTTVDDVRYQFGPYALSEVSNFKTAPFYNTSPTGVGSEGDGPSWGARGVVEGTTDIATGVIGAEGWVDMFIMVQESGTPDLYNIGVGFDFNGDGTIDESDPNEFDGTSFTRTTDTTDYSPSAPGIFTVGDISNDVYPLFIDSAEIYLPAPPSDVREWSLY